MTDSSSLHSTATSQRPLLNGDDDGSSLRTERPASVYTAADTVVGSEAKNDAVELQPFNPSLGIFTHRRYVRDEIAVLEYSEAKSSISGCVLDSTPRRAAAEASAL